MAETVVEYKISYENGATFKVQKQTDGGGYKTIVEIDENGNISDLWTHFQAAVEKNFSLDLSAIGNVMKG